MTTSMSTDQLPAVVREHLAAHAARDTETALRAFAPDATVTDQGRVFRGTEQVREFLERAGAGFSYTTELTGADRVDDRHWVARTRIEGDFPGGVADLAHRFTLDGDLVTELVIASA